MLNNDIQLILRTFSPLVHEPFQYDQAILELILMIELNEIEHVARLLLKSEQPKTACSTLLYLIELSKKHYEQQDLTMVAKTIEPKFHVRKNNVEFLRALQLLENVTKKDSGPNSSRFDNWAGSLSRKVRCSQRTAELTLIEQMTTIASKVLTAHSRVSCLLWLILVAIKVRRMTDMQEILNFTEATGNSTVRNIVDILAEIGEVVLVKTGDYRQATVLVLEVKDEAF